MCFHFVISVLWFWFDQFESGRFRSASSIYKSFSWCKFVYCKLQTLQLMLSFMVGPCCSLFFFLLCWMSDRLFVQSNSFVPDPFILWEANHLGGAHLWVWSAGLSTSSYLFAVCAHMCLRARFLSASLPTLVAVFFVINFLLYISFGGEGTVQHFFNFVKLVFGLIWPSHYGCLEKCSFSLVNLIMIWLWLFWFESLIYFF